MVDVRCFSDLDLAGTDIDDPVEELNQDLFHRLIERYGSNIDDPDRGVGLLDILSSSVDAEEIAARVRTDFRKDDRVETVTTKLTKLDEGEYLLEIDCQPIGSIAARVTTDGITRIK